MEFMQNINDAFYHGLTTFNPIVTEYKVYVNGLEIQGDEKITEVKIVPVSNQIIPPYNFEATKDRNYV